MTLDEVAQGLPNGLHDLLVDRVTIDFTARTATFEVSVWVGDLSSAGREARRPAQLALHGLQYCVLEPPDPKYPYAKPEPAWFVDLLDADPAIERGRVSPVGVFASRFFVNQWNSFVHVSAIDARLTWTGPQT